jgi:hypothetical protein
MFSKCYSLTIIMKKRYVRRKFILVNYMGAGATFDLTLFDNSKVSYFDD